MLRDHHSRMKAVRAISPVAVGTTGTGKTSGIVDTLGYGGVEFVFDYGTITATNATIIPTLLECATTGGSFTSVADADMLGTELGASITATTPRTSGVSKNVSFRLGYKGNCRYVKAKIVSTITAGPPVAATVLLMSANVAPVSAQ